MIGPPLALSPLFWSTLALALVLALVAAALVIQIARGNISVTVSWGRRTVEIPERTVEIRAPRHMIVDAPRSAARGRGRAGDPGEQTHVLDEEGELVVNESLTRSRYGLVHAVELVRIAPERVAYATCMDPSPARRRSSSSRTPDMGPWFATAEGSRSASGASDARWPAV